MMFLFKWLRRLLQWSFLFCGFARASVWLYSSCNGFLENLHGLISSLPSYLPLSNHQATRWMVWLVRCRAWMFGDWLCCTAAIVRIVFGRDILPQGLCIISHLRGWNSWHQDFYKHQCRNWIICDIAFRIGTLCRYKHKCSSNNNWHGEKNRPAMILARPIVSTAPSIPTKHRLDSCSGRRRWLKLSQSGPSFT